MNGALAGDRRTGREAADGMVHQHRTNIDDGTAALGLHGGYRGLAGEVSALQVDRVVAVEIRLLDIEEGFGRKHTGVVDQHVDAAGVLTRILSLPNSAAS